MYHIWISCPPVVVDLVDTRDDLHGAGVISVLLVLVPELPGR